MSQEERDEPLFVSPLSASFALSMLANGADGETLQELTDALGFSGYSMEEVNAYYKKLMEELPGTGQLVVAGHPIRRFGCI